MFSYPGCETSVVLLSGLFQILDVLCSLCVCNGVAVRTNQNLICDHLLPKRDLLLQSQLVNVVQRWGEKKSSYFDALVWFYFISEVGLSFEFKVSPISQANSHVVVCINAKY